MLKQRFYVTVFRKFRYRNPPNFVTMPTINEYYDAVLRCAIKKKQSDDLTSGQKWTPAAIRDRILKKLNSNKLDQHDLNILNNFFDNYKDGDHLIKIIRADGADKCKPITQFVNGITNAPNDHTKDLISVLIDFQPRPYKAWLEQYESKSENDGKSSGKENSVTESNPNQLPQTPNGIEKENQSTLSETESNNYVARISPDKKDDHKEKSLLTESKKPLHKIISNKWAGASIGAIMAIACLAFYPWAKKDCMYWNGERYIAIYCDDNSNIDGQVIAKNEELLTGFQKIMRADTLTAKHAGKVWYLKMNGNVEFFTKLGQHPVFQNRSLKEATEYILTKYAGENADEKKARLSD